MMIPKMPPKINAKNMLPETAEYCRHLQAGDLIFQTNRTLTILAVW